MEQKELFKILAVLFLYGFAAPALGLLLWKRRGWQRAAMAVLCFVIPSGLFGAGDWRFTLDFQEYRGHSTGYHFFYADALALALILSGALGRWKTFRLFPPGLLLYFFYCFLCLLSIINAPAPAFALMAAFKALKMSIYFLAAYNFIEDEDDLHLILKALAFTMFWQALVVLKMKYADGVYQVPGTFDHQNSLSMFATMIGMVFLAVSLGPKTPWSKWYLLAYVACAIIQQATLSRAGVVVYAGATVSVVALSLAEKVTRRRLAVLAGLATVSVVGLALTLDTIVARFHDYGNEASQKTREMLNEASSRMLSDYPLGIGWNNFALTINKPWPYGRIIDEWERAAGVRVDEDAPKGVVESWYWLHLAETGYQGFLGLAVFIGLFLWWNLRGFLHYRYHLLGAISLGIGAGCAWNYVHSLLERVLTQYRNMMLWMILLAVTAQIESWRRAERKRKRASRRKDRRRSEEILEEPAGAP